MAITQNEIEQLTKSTEAFMNHVHWVQQSFSLLPDKEHYGTCINYIDLQECREEFCKELVNTIPEWIYSQPKARNIIDELISEGRTELNAHSQLITLARDKFKNRGETDIFIQGQFGELLLFNFLQNFFSAIPLVRKMPIATTAAMERFGADAIHYSNEGGKHLFYLGEAKTYSSMYKFNSAFKDAIESILTTYKNHRKEIGLYVYDSFIEEPLVEIAREYKNGTIEGAEVHLVSIITYCENKSFEKNSEHQIKEDIIKIIEERGAEFDKSEFDKIDSGLLPRFNYIILPIWKLDELIIEFQKLIGK